MTRFATFGEIMLRLTPPNGGDKLSLAEAFSVGYAGAESNVAISLACLGNRVDYISKVPKNPIGKAALFSLMKYGVGTEKILLGGNRLGTYFIELGKSIRPSKVVYDRRGSSISELKAREFDWQKILENKQWLHLSGITPALSNQCAKETILAAKVAKENGVNVSFDLNFRRTLWNSGTAARKIFDQIIAHTDLIFGNLGVLSDVYGLEFVGKNSLEQTKIAIKEAQALFGVNHIAFTIREHLSASKNKLRAIALSDGEITTSKSYDIQIEDRFGTGDAFAAAYLHATSKQWEKQNVIEFATAAFALKHTVKGDVHISTENEVLTTMTGDLSGHVLR